MEVTAKCQAICGQAADFRIHYTLGNMGLINYLFYSTALVIPHATEDPFCTIIPLSSSLDEGFDYPAR